MIDNQLLNNLKKLDKNTLDKYLDARLDDLHRALETADGNEVLKIQGQIKELRTLINNVENARSFK